MPDDIQKPAETAKPAPMDDGNKTVEAQIEALKAELAATKQAQAGSDKKVAELLSEREQTKAAKQTDAERIAALEKKAADAEMQTARERFLASGYKMAAERGLKATLVDRFNGNLDELKAFLDEVKGDFDAARVAEANKIMTETGHKPGSGNETGSVDPKKMTAEARLAYYQAEAEKRMGGAT